jgi:hypothetical protein
MDAGTEKLLILGGVAALAGLGIYAIYEAAANAASTSNASLSNSTCKGAVHTFTPEEYDTSTTKSFSIQMAVGDCLVVDMTGVSNIAFSTAGLFAGPYFGMSDAGTALYTATTAGQTVITFTMTATQTVLNTAATPIEVTLNVTVS